MNLDPWPSGRDTAPPEGSPANKISVYVPLSLLICVGTILCTTCQIVYAWTGCKTDEPASTIATLACRLGFSPSLATKDCRIGGAQGPHANRNMTGFESKLSLQYSTVTWDMDVGFEHNLCFARWARKLQHGPTQSRCRLSLGHPATLHWVSVVDVWDCGLPLTDETHSKDCMANCTNGI